MQRPTRTSNHTALLGSAKLSLSAWGIGLALATAVGGVTSGCGSKEDANGDPCATVYKGTCGNTCASDTDCHQGQYCSPTNGTCKADCAAGAASCGSGFSCTGQGRCEAGGLFGNNGGPTNGTDGSVCGGERHRGEGLPADIYIMNDQSQSMSCAIPTGGTRWDAMVKALNGFVGSQEATGLGVGIQYFGLAGPGGGGGRGGNIQGSCDPAVYTPADVEIAALPGNAQNLIQSLGRHGPSTYTPTPAAIQGALAHAKQWAIQNPSHIVSVVLATDGQPNLCGNPADRIGDVANFAAAAFNGSPQLRTYVIGIVGGSSATGGIGCALDPAPPNEPDLSRVAKAGGTDKAFIVDAAKGDTSAQFLTALNSIRGAAVIPCQYALAAADPTKPIDPGKVNVTFTPTNGTEQPLLQAADAATCGSSNGWYYDNPGAPTKILLCPTTCSVVEGDATAAVDVLIGCQTNTIPTR